MIGVKLKAHVLALVEQEESLEKLAAVQALLSDAYVFQSWEKEELQRSVARSEEDIKAGRVHSVEEVKSQLSKFWEDRD